MLFKQFRVYGFDSGLCVDIVGVDFNLISQHGDGIKTLILYSHGQKSHGYLFPC